jgi:hypothetical protein
MPKNVVHASPVNVYKEMMSFVSGGYKNGHGAEWAWRQSDHESVSQTMYESVGQSASMLVDDLFSQSVT